MLQSCFVQCHRLPCCEYFLAALVAYNILVCIKHFQITFCKVGRYFLSSMILAACEAESFLLFFSRFFRPQICLAPQHEKIATDVWFWLRTNRSITYVQTQLPLSSITGRLYLYPYLLHRYLRRECCCQIMTSFARLLYSRAATWWDHVNRLIFSRTKSKFNLNRSQSTVC
jgi:hypothetical protein